MKNKPTEDDLKQLELMLHEDSYVSANISDGGIEFSVEKGKTSNGDLYPILNITAFHFGHQTNGIKLMIKPEDFEKIGKWFIEKSKQATWWSTYEYVYSCRTAIRTPYVKKEL